MPIIKNFKIGTFTDQRFLFCAIAGLGLLHYGQPPEGREHTTFEMILMGSGVVFLFAGVGSLLPIHMTGYVTNQHEQNIESGFRINVAEDPKDQSRCPTRMNLVHDQRRVESGRGE